MSRPNLYFETIEIIRRPGFERRGFHLTELASGVNVIHGPNAAGKTSLSETIQRLLRPSPGATAHESLVAHVRIEGERHRLAYDSGQPTCQRDGTEVEYPKMAPPDVSDRYVLALPDLIRDEDAGDLAELIVRESAGGYDVEQARKELGYRDRLTSGNAKVFGAHEEARRKHGNAVVQQIDLFGQEQDLDELKSKRKNARDAKVELDWLQRAEAHLQAKQAAAAAERRVKEDFSEGMVELRDSDVEQLDQLRDTADTARSRLSKAQRELADAREYIKKSRLPADGVAPDTIAAMKQQAQDIRDLAGKIASAKRDVEKAAAQKEHARASLGREVSREQAEQLDQDTIRELIQFARGAERLRSAKTAEDELHRWLGDDVPPSGEEVESLRYGVELLQRWLAVRPYASSPIPLFPAFIAFAMTVMSLVFATALHPSWLLALLPAVVLAGWIWAMRTSKFVPNRTNDVRQEFESLSVEHPADWSDESVRTHVRTLARRHASASLGCEKAAHWAGREEQRAILAERMNDTQTQRQDWAKQLGMDVAADEASLVMVAETVHRFWQAAGEHASEVADRDELQKELNRLLKGINNRLSECGLDGVDEPSLASSRVELLGEESREHRAARKTVDGSVTDDLSNEVAKCDKQIEAIYRRVGLTPADEATLRQWARRFDDYQSAVKDVHLAQHQVKATKAALSERVDLLDCDREMLATEGGRCEESAARWESLNKQIVEIETRVVDANKSHDIEAALGNLRACEDALRHQRTRDQEAMVGDVLAEFLVRDQWDHQQLGVFRRAQELFARITHGRYRLDIDPGDPPRFRAFDTDREVGVALDHLSSGTRLQLLLSVRVAFVERQEHGLKLPLVLDEALANSDPQREQQIIDAVIEICRDGRQIFYLTAKHEEVAKWRRAMTVVDDVEYREVNLAEVRCFSESEQAPVMDYQPPPRIEIPAPDRSDWLAYGQQLSDLPPLDPRGPAGGIHLWYLIDDLPTLYELLRHEINKWGQLKNLVAIGAARTIQRDSPVFQRAEAAARAIAETCHSWQVGRGSPIDRATLLNSDAVSEKFLEPVAELAVRFDGDAAAVIEAIYSKEVSGFRQSKRDVLRDFFLQNGYLDARDVLEQQQVVERVVAAMYPDLEQDLISSQRIAHYVAMVFGSAQADAPVVVASP